MLLLMSMIVMSSRFFVVLICVEMRVMIMGVRI